MTRATWLPLVTLAACTPEVYPDDRPATDETSVSARPAPAASAPLGDTLGWLAEEVALRSGGTELAIAVIDLQTGERAEIAGDVLHVSASSAKAWWVAAALNGTSIDAVRPHASAIFTSSDNYASGAAIDLVGPNAVNTFLWDAAGMTNTALTQWSYGGPRGASNSPRLMGSDNYTTANDAVTFLSRLHRHEILAGERADALLAWMKLSPDSGVGGWIPARLPAAVQGNVMHKGGWLPPGCCGDDRTYNTLNDVGIVTAPDGRAYAVAVLTRRGHDYWGKQARFAELASCSIYRAFTQDESIDCARPGDPVPAETCGDVTYQGYCDGAAVVWCENGSLNRKSCAATGRTCAWQTEEIGFNCVDAVATGCGDVTYQGYCEDQTVVWCEAGSLRRKDCATASQVCGFQDDTVGYNCQ